jgi:hydrogenase maturation factor HypE
MTLYDKATATLVDVKTADSKPLACVVDTKTADDAAVADLTGGGGGCESTDDK